MTPFFTPSASYDQALVDSDTWSVWIMSSSSLTGHIQVWFMPYDNFGKTCNLGISTILLSFREEGTSSKFPGADTINTVSWVFRWSLSVTTFTIS